MAKKIRNEDLLKNTKKRTSQKNTQKAVEKERKANQHGEEVFWMTLRKKKHNMEQELRNAPKIEKNGRTQ